MVSVPTDAVGVATARPGRWPWTTGKGVGRPMDRKYPGLVEIAAGAVLSCRYFFEVTATAPYPIAAVRVGGGLIASGARRMRAG